MSELKLIKIENLPPNPDGALTLYPSYLGKHDDGWEIVGEVHEDWCEWVNRWVNRFVAYKHISDIYGDEQIVCGDFEEGIWATSQNAYDEFVKSYPPDSWDYDDI